MRNRKLKLDPQHVAHAEDWWFYEQAKGITVVVEFYDPATLTEKVGVRQVTIPWARIRSAVARKDAP